MWIKKIIFYPHFLFQIGSNSGFSGAVGSYAQAYSNTDYNYSRQVSRRIAPPRTHKQTTAWRQESWKISNTVCGKDTARHNQRPYDKPRTLRQTDINRRTDRSRMERFLQDSEPHPLLSVTPPSGQCSASTPNSKLRIDKPRVMYLIQTCSEIHETEININAIDSLRKTLSRKLIFGISIRTIRGSPCGQLLEECLHER